MGVNRQTLYVSMRGTNPISGKTLEKLSAAERLFLTPESDTSDVVEEPVSTYGAKLHQPTYIPRPEPHSPYSDYLAFLRACSSEAQKLAAGDPAKAALLFDRMLAVWERSEQRHQKTTTHHES